MMNGGLGGGLWMVLVWPVSIVPVIWAPKAFSGTSGPGGRTKTALELLDEEYAKGKIGGEE
jgi:uncharacterized membrane protein